MAEKLVEDARCLENDKDFYSVMNDLWNNYLKPDEKSGNVPVQYDDARILAKFVSTKDAPVIVCALLEMIVRMPPASQQQIIRAIGRLAITGQSMVKQVTNSLVSLRTTGGRMVSYGIVACALAWEVFQSVRSWWKGEISGARCVKNIIDSAAGCAAGVAGGFAGAYVGNMIFPGVGAVIGGVIGGAASANVASNLSDWLTQWLFGLPKEVALENAFRFLELPVDSSNDAINSKYRELALKFHPDKGGNRDDWERLQFALAVIKVSRETDDQTRESQSKPTSPLAICD